MAVSSGFFNSLNGDRRYFATQFAMLFDGILNNGVYANIGNAFAVTANAGNTIAVDVGLAWFNSAWLYNDAILSITAPESEVILDRYDAVVLEIDHSDITRDGSIKFVTGTPASNPAYPTLTKTEKVVQLPLAYIYRTAGSTAITQADIMNMVGTSSCPYITGILQVQDIDKNVAQWEAQWSEWSSKWAQWEIQWSQWYNGETAGAEAELDKFITDMQNEFDAWFAELQSILEGDSAAQLAERVLDLQNKFSILAAEGCVYEDLKDSNDDTITDSDGNVIEGRTVLGSSGNAANEDYKDYVDSRTTSAVLTKTLLASKWIGEEAPFIYNLDLIDVTNISKQEFLPGLGLSKEQLEVLQAANIQDGGQTPGSAILCAYGDKPEIDLPIRVIMRGDI